MPRTRNQYASGARRPERLPIVPVTHQEHTLVERYCEIHRLSYAQVMRSALFTLGALTVDSLFDLPKTYAADVIQLAQGRRS